MCSRSHLVPLVTHRMHTGGAIRPAFWLPPNVISLHRVVMGMQIGWAHNAMCTLCPLLIGHLPGGLPIWLKPVQAYAGTWIMTTNELLHRDTWELDHSRLHPASLWSCVRPHWHIVFFPGLDFLQVKSQMKIFCFDTLVFACFLCFQGKYAKRKSRFKRSDGSTSSDTTSNSFVRQVRFHTERLMWHDGATVSHQVTRTHWSDTHWYESQWSETH